jgi:predicted aspartyl protease
VNGKSVNWFVDTAFSTSGLTEAEARMLGLSVQGGVAVEDLAGGTTRTRTATAERMVVGGMELQNVPLLVFPDSQQPWNDQAPGHRGALGLPVAVALQAIHWSVPGTCQVGPDATRSSSGTSNLAFDGSTLFTRARFDGKSLDFVLDTGNQAGTQLWARFARDFSALVSERGQKSTAQLNQIGGSSHHEIVVLPEIRLQLGGVETLLKPANIFSKPVGNDVQYGLVGMDLLSQATDVTIDFRSMSLTLRQGRRP